MADQIPMSDVTGWILAGGEGRRMGGINKGLQVYRGKPLVHWVIEALRPQTSALALNANRDLDAYANLLGDPEQVWSDDPDISGSLGPLAGILTGLRRTATPWLITAACDTPALPGHLVDQLRQSAVQHEAEIAVPFTQTDQGETHHHWTCALIHTRARPSLEAALARGERRVGQWIKSRSWTGVSFAHPAAFININTLETLHGQA